MTAKGASIYDIHLSLEFVDRLYFPVYISPFIYFLVVKVKRSKVRHLNRQIINSQQKVSCFHPLQNL